MRVSIDGNLVGIINRPFDFTDDQSGERVVGRTAAIFVSNDPSDGPTRIHVPARPETPEQLARVEAFDAFLATGPKHLGPVTLTVDIDSKGKFSLAGAK